MNCALFVSAVVAALFATACAQERLNNRLVALPTHFLENATDFDTLRSGRPVVGTVELGESRLIRFAVPAVGKHYPDVIVTLTSTNEHGDADVFCAPWIYLRNLNRYPGPRSHIWRSIHSQELDTIFISSKSTEFKDSIVDLPDENNGTQVAAAFACSIVGESNTPSEFELDLDLSVNAHKLVKEEQNAMKSIFKKCCTEDSCKRWLVPTSNTTELVKVAKGTKVELDFCHRYGNVCTAGGRLKRLDMRGYNLTCPLPVEELTKLEFLQKLDLDRNQLTGDAGEILAGLAGLSNLVRLSLASNKISGTMSSPPEACGLFEGGLQFINLKGNGINGRLPACVLASPVLRELHLGHNALFGRIPDEVPEDSALEAISLSSNKMSGTVPESLGNAKWLRFVYLGRNRLKGKIPNSLGTLPLLENLDLSSNKLTEFPSAWTSPEWTPQGTLRQFSVASNSIDDKFPQALGRAENLVVFDISGNAIHGELVIEDGWFVATRNFNASFNKLEGPIPKAVQGMGVFKPIPLTLGDFPRFDIRANEMSGEIPDFFYPNVTASITYRGIHLEDNDFTCQSPAQLSYIFELECEPASNGSPDQEETARLTEALPTNDSTVAIVTKRKESSSSSSKKSSVEVVVPAVLGSLAGLVIVAVIIVVVLRRKKAKKAIVKFPSDEGDIRIGEVAAEPNKQDSTRILPGDVARS